jgi:tetratricopeptide (TPR) repeat protein
MTEVAHAGVAHASTVNAADALQQASSHHQAGRLTEAEQGYRSVLAARPDDVTALALLGMLSSQTNRLDDALRWFERALAIDPRLAFVHNNRGIVLARLRRFEEALASFDRAIEPQPDYVDAFNNRGTVLLDLGRPADALASYDKALALQPTAANVEINRATALLRLKRDAEALAACDHAIDLQPRLANAWINRGSALEALQRPEEALASYDRALALQPEQPIAWFNRGNALRSLQRPADALVSFGRALGLRPDFTTARLNHAAALRQLNRNADALADYDAVLAVGATNPDVWFDRGSVLAMLGRHEDAIASHDRALALRPDMVEAYFERGNALQELRRFDEALASYDRAIAIDPNAAGAHLKRGNVLQQLARHEEALAAYAETRAHRPEMMDAHWNEALSRLTLGDFRSGWRGYERRWQVEPYASARRHFPQPLWLGDAALTGKTILLHSEQGFGDTLQFCRYVPLIARRARVVLEVQPALLRLFATLDGVHQVVRRGDPLPAVDLQCPLMSLPLALDTTLATIPATAPYLRTDPVQVAAWRGRLAELPGLRVGLAWAGEPRHDDPHAHAMDRRRSIALERLAPLAAIAGVSWISLQKGPAAAQATAQPPGMDLHDWTDEIGDFADTAALIEALDLVISVDTAVAHLAGALARPVWLLNRFDTCWRWLLQRSDSPWYPTMHIYRQPARGDWTSVLAAVAAALHEQARSPRRRSGEG